MTIKQMYLRGNSATGFCTTKPRVVPESKAFSLRDRCERVRFNWDSKVLNGVRIIDSEDRYLDSMQFASLYRDENEQYVFFERF